MKPNILFLLIDTFRADKFSGKGKTSKTPNLDSLITNGAYFSRCKNVIKKEKMFGDRPVFFEVPWLASLEIREKEQMSLFSSLIHKYFQEEF